MRDEQGRTFSLLDDLRDSSRLAEFGRWLFGIAVFVTLGAWCAWRLDRKAA